MDCEPTDAVISGDITLPAGPETNATTAVATALPHALFQFQTNRNKSTACSSGLVRPTNQTSSASKIARTQAVLDELRRPLKLPEALRAQNLTRSALMFSIGTSIDPRALDIQGDEEFYLFMDLRAQEQWTVLGMTNQKWASAAKTYNTELKERSKRKGFEFVKKNPQALGKKLSEIEPRILDRISRNNYICTFTSLTQLYSLFQRLIIALSQLEKPTARLFGVGIAMRCPLLRGKLRPAVMLPSTWATSSTVAPRTGMLAHPINRSQSR